MVLFSRDCRSVEELQKEAADRARLKRENPEWSDEEVEKQLNPKKYEYFILTRGFARGCPARRRRHHSDGPCRDRSILQPGGRDSLFNGAGAQQFGKITRRNKPSGNKERLLAVLLDDKLVSAATIRSEITSQGQITGKFDRKKVDRDVQILRSGALSQELREKPVSENTHRPDPRAATRSARGRWPSVWRSSPCSLFMVVYYRFAGMVACVALFANLLLTVGFMVVVNATFTLPGLAGLGADARHGGRRQRAHLRAAPRGAEQGREPRHRHPQRLRPGLPHDHRHAPDEHLHRHRAVHVRQRSAQGLRDQPDGRPGHQPVHVAVHDAADVRLLAAPQVADRVEDDATLRDGRTFIR